MVMATFHWFFRASASAAAAIFLAPSRVRTFFEAVCALRTDASQSDTSIARPRDRVRLSFIREFS